MSSAYDNVVGGRLKLKGKALDVKAAGIKKKKKQQHNKNLHDEASAAAKLTDNEHNENLHDEASAAAKLTDNDLSVGGSTDLLADASQEDVVDASKPTGENAAHWDEHLTPAERRYVEQREKIDRHRLAKTANKSHRDRIQDFNQYLANMSEHYDIPKVGPG